MKILQVFNRYQFRGGEEAWVDAIPNLLGDSATVEELRFHSSDWTGSNKPSLLQQARWIGDNPESRVALRKKVRDCKPELLLFHNVIPVASLGLYEEAKALRLPVLQYTHNFRPFSPSGTLWNGKTVQTDAMHGNPWPEILSGAWQNSRIKTGILALHLKRAIKRGLINCVDHWLAISDFMREQFIMAGISQEKITTLRHCHQITHCLSASDKQDHYLYLGRLVPEKGVQILLDAWKIIHKQLGANCPKLIIAGDGPMDTLVRETAGKISSVEYIGFVSGEQKETLIDHSRAIIVPSVWLEPLGLTVYDAYSHGRPVVAARSGGLQETVIHEETGWSYDPHRPQELADNIISIEKAGAAERNMAGKKGFEWLRNNADIATWRKQFISLCHEAVEHRKKSKT